MGVLSLLAGCGGSAEGGSPPGGSTGGALATGGTDAGGTLGESGGNGDAHAGAAGVPSQGMGGDTGGATGGGTGGDAAGGAGGDIGPGIGGNAAGGTDSAGGGGTGGADCPTGTERCPCYGNGTCNIGLTCASDVCVDLGAGGTTGGTGGTGGVDASGGAGGTCTATVESLGFAPVNLVFAYDKSGSMGAGSGWDRSTTHWIPARAGFLAYLREPESRWTGAALEFFPAEGDLTDACNVANYETPSVSLVALNQVNPDTSPFVLAFDSTVPGGGTPTLPALLGSLNYARTLAEEYPDASIAVVLITDGLPVFYIDGASAPGCTQPLENTVENTAAIAAEGLADGIPTHVIALDDEASELSSLVQVGIAGGTETARFIATGDPVATANELQQTLDSIRDQYLGCTLPLSGAPSDADYARADVFATASGVTDVLPQTPGCVGDGGWQYLYTSADPATPTHIELCGLTCQSVQATPGVELSVEFGCVEEDTP